MGYDPFLPISVAQINILCVPVGKITRPKFEELLRALQAFSVTASRTIKNETSSFSKYKDSHVLLNISRDVQQDDSEALEKAGTNAKPQIVVGLIDGEALDSTPDENHHQWLQTAFARLCDNTEALNPVAIPTLVVLGGERISVPKECYFVDLDGDGPSLPDVVQNLISRFQSQLEVVPRGVQTESSEQASESSATQSSPPSSFDRNSATARNAVLLGQINLLAGQWPEALRQFSEAAASARDASNPFWHARALEGLLVCMLLFAWSHLDFNIPQICYPPSDKKGPVYNSPSMSAICAANRSASDALSTGRSISSAHNLTQLTPHLLNTIISLYERAAGIHQDSQSFKLLCRARVRWGNLLLVLKTHGSNFSDAALQYLVEGDDTGITGKTPDSSAISLILHVKSLTKLFVDAALEAQAKLSVQHAAQVQIAVALNLSLLGVERKQAFHLREFLQRLGPALLEARRVGAAEVGIHPSANLPPLNSPSDGPDNNTRSGIQALLDSVCEIYGLPRQEDADSGQSTEPERRLREALCFWSAAHQTGDITMKIDILNLCIEISDAIPDLRCSLNYMARLLHIAVGKVTFYGNNPHPPPLITSTDQSRILHNMRRVVAAAAKYGMADVRAGYWDKCLVRFIEVSEDASATRLIPRTAQDLSLASTAKAETRRDPFIFNAFARTKGGVGRSVVVVGEQARFSVVLQNPLQVEVEIEDIVLLTEGCDFEADHHNIVLGPLCSQTFTLTGKARKEGDLLVKGCRATIRGCYAEDFVIVQGERKPSRATKLMAGSSTSESWKTVALPNITQVRLKVAAPLPKLSIVATSLLQQSIMLLEGEKTAFDLTLRNDSDLDVDFVMLTFEDSVTRRLEEALNNKDLLPADMYEIQNQIASRPVVRLKHVEGGQKAKVAAQDMVSYTLELFGRPGLTDITVIVDYARLGKVEDVVGDSFYTRQLRHAITTTITGSIDIPRCSVLPLEGDLLTTYQKHHHESNRAMLFSALGNKWDETDQCLLLLDVRNIWPQPLDVEFQASHPPDEEDNEAERWKDGCTVNETLQPGQMTRLLLLAPRILVTDPYAPIPSLDTKRQFVVSASKMTIEAEAASRESFWYRERLLKCLQATWKEQNGTRRGQVDMRKGIRLSSRMIDALRIDLVEVSFSLKSSQQDDGTQPPCVTQTGDARFSVTRNSFATIVTSVHNHSTEELRLLLRLQPALRNQPHGVALDLSKRFAWTGVLQRALHPPLKAGEKRHVDLGIVALAEGEYEVNGTVEEIKSRSARTESTALEVGSGAERRVWQARRPCLIDAVDENMK